MAAQASSTARHLQTAATRRVRVLLALAALHVALLAGCTGEPVVVHERPDLAFEGFKLDTTPYEPFEMVGNNHIGYAGDLFGVFAEREDDMPRYAIVAPDAVYTSDFLMGWTKHPSIAAIPETRAWRLHAWDIRTLIDEADYDGQLFHGRIAVRGQTHDYVVDARNWTLTGKFEPETPYTFTPEPIKLPFPLQVPEAMTAAQQQQPNDAARANHVKIIQWLRAHAQQNAGGVPDEVTASSLALQRLGASWPVNPFDGQALGNREESGHFAWIKCGAGDAIYLGYAWDGSPIGESFGSGCNLQTKPRLNL